MQENYTLTKKIECRVKLAVAYSKALQKIRSKKLNKTILINLN
jgi:hypothetical protein